MRLKYLELSGFKSFPKRTRIEFPQGICAIVGPNGCGKSNIVDAIRWVLGEQSPSVLRARSMEELLYSGNTKSCNLAWVRLLIEEKDTDNSMFPPELAHLSEIEIERQLWRTGESKYLLNRKVCRLRDIEYLFLDTGASRKSFAIIDQGKIGSIIEAGASQYKNLIEEIAGISRYKARRLQTQQKLCETSQNLERLKDIILEVESQAKELKRQAKRCEEFISLKREYEDVELAIFWLRYKEKYKRLIELNKNKEELTTKIAKLSAKKDRLYKELISLDIKISDISKQLDSYRNRYLDLQKLISNKEVKLSQSKSRFNILNDKISAINSELNKNKKKQIFLDKQVNELKNKEEKYINEKETYSIEFNKINERLNNEFISKIDILNSDIETIKNQLVEVESYIAKYNREKEFITKQLNQLSIKKTKNLEKLTNLSKELEDIGNKRQDEELILEKLKDELNNYKLDSSKLERKISKLEELITSFKLDRQKLHFEYKLLEQKIIQLKKELNSQSDFLPGTRLLLKNFKTCGIVADFINVEAGIESFIELSLGRLLEAVIFTDLEELNKAIEFIKSKNYPEANILFLKDFNPDEPNLFVSNICINNDNKTISYHPQLKPFIHQKINISVVSRDSFNLKNVFTNSLGCLNYITDDKHIIVTNRSLLSFITSYKEGILSKKIQLNKLIIQKEEYQKILNSVDLKLEKTKNLLYKQKTKNTNIKNKINILTNEISNKTKIIEVTLSQIEIINNKKKAIKFELSDIETQLLHLNNELNSIDDKIHDKVILKNKLHDNLNLKQKEFNNIKDQYNNLQKIKSDLIIKIARLEENIKSIKLEIDKTIQNKESTIKRYNQIKSERDKLNIEIDKVSQEISLKEKELNTLREQIQHIESSTLELETNLKENKEIFNKIDKNFKEKSSELSKLEHILNDLDVEISKTDFQLNELLTITKQQVKLDLTKLTNKDIKYNNLDIHKLTDKLKTLSAKIDNFGPINLEASKQYEDISNRLEELYKQYNDLEISILNLKKAISEIDTTCKKALLKTLNQINEQLSQIFPILFKGSSAKLKVVDDSDILNAQFELSIKIPGKRIKHIGLLSGGEKALASMAFVFSLYLTKASPFCILDEIDAPLDQANIEKLNKLLELLSKKTQIILITHNQSVMEIADVIYGVTMEETGVSKVICLPLKDLFTKEAQYA